MKVTVKYFYGEIIYLTKTISRLGLTTDLMEAAMQQDLNEMKEILETFKIQNPLVWKRMSNFYKDYEDEACPTIFGTQESIKKYYKFDLAYIRPLDFICLVAVSNGVIDEEDMFEELKIFQQILVDNGYNKFANYIVDNMVNTLEDLVRVFKKK